jgi:hypothetical protein
MKLWKILGIIVLLFALAIPGANIVILMGFIWYLIARLPS